ncbi:AAA family ATPase [Pseudochelatococcus sp. G4_1912]|uniref:bifunctional aminoglycoside phosphotransferase/ATP-binding protein n=1 Tax=Pseudochelatococcus sp. G4_1912 TaxID=3114288 RepID=UPI0039C70BC0
MTEQGRRKRVIGIDAEQDALQQAVFAFLMRPESHGVTDEIKRIDTHGAVVFLAGDHVYKVKRAVRYSFMDFSTLEKRRAVCEAEIAVNSANAPGIYLGVVPILRADKEFQLGKDGADMEGDIVEWAVHMRRFDEASTLDHLVMRNNLPSDIAHTLAAMVVRAHRNAPMVPDPLSSVVELGRYVRRNAEALSERPDLFPPERVLAVKAAGLAALDDLQALLLARAEAGDVRHCHGDMHLRNIVLIDGAPVLFDAIEFDDSIATVDLLYDLAFLLMDLWERGLHDVANGVLNRYLWARGHERDLAGLAALPFFLSLRAGVRAMVTAVALPHLQDKELEQAQAEACRYLAMAEGFLSPQPVRLMAIGGLSGSGKSTLARFLAPDIGRPVGAVHLRSDIERKTLFNVAETTRLPPEAYTLAVTTEVYARLRRRAELALRAGQSVIVDAVYATEVERLEIENVARHVGVRFDGFWLEAPMSTLEARVEARINDASDADTAVVRRQSTYDIGAISWNIVQSDTAPQMALADVRHLLD